jgi:hypothetical protein
MTQFRQPTKAEEKMILKSAMINHNRLKRNRPMYNELRNEMIHQIINFGTPKWGSIRLNITKAGV